MSITPKENYLRMMRGEIPEYMPSYVEPYMMGITEELLTPQTAPNGPIVTSLGVTYVGNAETNYGAMPQPNNIIISDITKWRDQLKIRDISGRDWEGFYKNAVKDVDRNNVCLCVDGGDYFLTLVSLLGFENTLIAMHEEPEEVKALLEHISEFYTTVLKQQMYYLKPEVYVLMDDDAAYQSPFFSLDMYREFFKPFHKRHCDIARDAGAYVDRHDCGKSEQFIDDWLEIGVRGWNPVQVTNDCKGIKKKYGDRLALMGAWDTGRWGAAVDFDEKALTDELVEYVDTFAPGGNFTFAPIMGTMGINEAETTKRKQDFVTKFFYDYARGWYDRH